jgi:hypothetical protein
MGTFKTNRRRRGLRGVLKSRPASRGAVRVKGCRPCEAETRRFAPLPLALGDKRWA